MSELNLQSIQQEIARLKQELRNTQHSSQTPSQPVYNQQHSDLYSGSTANASTQYHHAPQGSPHQTSQSPGVNTTHQLSAVNTIMQRLQAIRADLKRKEEHCHNNIRIVSNQHNIIHEVKEAQSEYQTMKKVMQNEITEIQRLVREIDGTLSEAKQTSAYLNQSGGSTQHREINTAINQASNRLDYNQGYGNDLSQEILYFWNEDQKSHLKYTDIVKPVPQIKQTNTAAVDSLVDHLADSGFAGKKSNLERHIYSLVPYKRKFQYQHYGYNYNDEYGSTK